MPLTLYSLSICVQTDYFAERLGQTLKITWNNICIHKTSAYISTSVRNLVFRGQILQRFSCQLSLQTLGLQCGYMLWCSLFHGLTGILALVLGAPSFLMFPLLFLTFLFTSLPMCHFLPFLKLIFAQAQPWCPVWGSHGLSSQRCLQPPLSDLGTDT